MRLKRMENAALKREADELVRQVGLAELLSPYPAWFIGGSYSYDLMCWRDLDVYILDPLRDLKRCFEIARELTQRLAARKASFTNNVDGDPSGLYWGIKLGDARQGAWKLDVWFLGEDSYQRHVAYSRGMRERLTNENREIILAIKEDYWRRPSYRDTITSDMIYRAVLDRRIKTIREFEELVNEGSA